MMPSGVYWIGDLCYVMHDEWQEFCKLTIINRECISGEFNLKDGRRFATYQTMYGDGEYMSSVGKSLPVDAGLIGCILLSDIVKNPENKISLGAIVKFNSAFETSSEDGIIRFGHVSIDTAGEDDYY